MRSGLTIKNLNAGYGPTRIVHDLNLEEIKDGTLVGLIGPNAAGKSTFLKSLAGLNSYSGAAELDGYDLKQMSQDARVKLVGYLPQALPAPSSLLVYESVLSALRLSDPHLEQSEVDRKLEQIFLDLNLQEEAFRRVIELSGGKRQLVGLAQVFVRQPRLMLLDEPTSALDLKRQIQIYSHVSSIAKENGNLAILAAHDINLTMRFCDIILVLSRGHLLASGAPSEVITPDILRQVYGVEARVEKCSKGRPIVIADGVTETIEAMEFSK